jgi:hypothetical protein
MLDGILLAVSVIFPLTALIMKVERTQAFIVGRYGMQIRMLPMWGRGLAWVRDKWWSTELWDGIRDTHALPESSDANLGFQKVNVKFE